MPLPAVDDADARLDLFLDHVTAPLLNSVQRATFAEYAVGLLSDAERKSMEPLAAQARPDCPGGAHKAFVYFTGTARWDDRAVRRHAAAWALWGVAATGKVLGTILDDTGMLKQGKHSVGVSRQYTGSAGKIANCQVVVTMAAFTAQHTVALDAQLYLPQSWTDDDARRKTARIPEGLGFRTKGEIALAMLREAHADAVPLGEMLLADADYGRLWPLRQWCREVGMRYAVGIHPTQKVWDAAGTWISALTAAEYAACVPAKSYRRITWRTGANGQNLSARFAFLRVQVTQHGEEPVSEETPSEWLVIEWRDGEDEPRHFYLCDLPEDITWPKLVGTIKERWRIEQLHQELKGEVGFDHFEGRSWPGWQHHVSVALACHALLVGERCVDFPPSAPRRPAAGPHRRTPRSARPALHPEHQASHGPTRL